MQTTLFVMPIKTGKNQAYLDFLAECMGPKKEEYLSLLERYALNNIKIWTHQIDGKDYALFTHDMSDDAQQRMANWANSKHPFSQWFDQKLRECYGVDFDHQPEQPAFFGALGS